MAGIMLQLASICVFPITMCNLTGSILNALNLETKSFVNYIIGSCVLLLGLTILTPIIGINSIIISHFISMSVISLLNLSKIKKVVPNLKINLISLTFKYSIIIAPSSILGHFISNICLHFFTNFFSAFIGGGISVLSVAILSKLLHIFDFKNLIEILTKKKKLKS